MAKVVSFLEAVTGEIRGVDVAQEMECGFSEGRLFEQVTLGGKEISAEAQTLYLNHCYYWAYKRNTGRELHATRN